MIQTIDSYFGHRTLGQLAADPALRSLVGDFVNRVIRSQNQVRKGYVDQHKIHCEIHEGFGRDKVLDLYFESPMGVEDRYQAIAAMVESMSLKDKDRLRKQLKKGEE